MIAQSVDEENLQGFRREAIVGLSEAAGRLGMSPEAFPLASPIRAGRETTTAEPRRIALVDLGGGALEWRDFHEASRGPLPPIPRVRPAPTATPLIALPVEELSPNEITARLQEWDDRLTPHQGLKRWCPESGRLVSVVAVPPVENPVGKPSGILLVLHGTFSHGESIFDQLQAVEPRSDFLSWAQARYEHILAFDHPTLSIGPMLNALDLARLFAGVTAPVDMVCHSRGGLVARWWLEAFRGASEGPRRAVFVSSPLGGTSLAAPPNIRRAMNLFVSVGTHLKAAGEAGAVFLPFLTIGTALAGALGMIAGTVSAAPLSDLVFSAIPGLGSMSRVGNHPELSRLQAGTGALPPYFAIRSDFHLEAAGWKFWRHFSKKGLSQWGADLIFDGPNDLVVENGSTIEIRRGEGLAADRVCHFAASQSIHHTNYFEQPAALEALRRFLD